MHHTIRHHDAFHSMRVLLHGSEEASEPVSQYAECVFYHSACPGQPVVENSLFFGHVSNGVGFHESRSSPTKRRTLDDHH